MVVGECRGGEIVGPTTMFVGSYAAARRLGPVGDQEHGHEARNYSLTGPLRTNRPLGSLDQSSGPQRFALT
jgi:hypothetical protein